MKKTGLEFIISLRDKITAPLKNIQALKDKITKPLNMIAQPKSINDLNSRLERLIELRNKANSPKWLSKFNAEIDKTQKQIGKLEGTGKGFFGRMFDGAKGFLAAQAITAVTTGIMAYGSSAVSSFDAAEKANAQLSAVLSSTGNAAGQTMQSLTSEAERLSKITLFDDDTIKGAQGLMLTFTDVKNKVFKDSIPLIQDMATAMAGEGPADLKGATIQVGKALNDPIKGITALSRVGVTFSDSQKDLIKSLVETGDKAGAQQLILAELRKEFGGSAEAAAQAGMGPLQLLQIRFGEIQEAIGGLIVKGLLALQPAFTIIATVIEGFVDGLTSMFDWMGKNSEMLKDIGIALGIGAIAAGLYAIAIHGVAIAKGVWATVTGALATAQAWLNAMLLANPIYLIIAGITAAIAIFIYFYQNSELVRGAIKALWEGIKFYFLNIAKLTLDIWGNVGKIIKSALTLDGDGLASGISGLKSAFSSFGSGLSDSMSKGYAEGVQDIKNKNAAAQIAEKAQAKKKPFVNFETLGNTDAEGKPKKSKSAQDTEVNRISGEAKNQRNITVNIGKFGEINIQNMMASDKSVKQTIDEFADMLREALMREVRNFETAI
jgi:hypothetical protein